MIRISYLLIASKLSQSSGRPIIALLLTVREDSSGSLVELFHSLRLSGLGVFELSERERCQMLDLMACSRESLWLSGIKTGMLRTVAVAIRGSICFVARRN